MMEVPRGQDSGGTRFRIGKMTYLLQHHCEVCRGLESDSYVLLNDWSMGDFKRRCLTDFDTELLSKPIQVVGENCGFMAGA